jgi:PAS domain S-box-containing protein
MNADSGDPLSPRQEDYFQTLADGAPVMIWMSGVDKLCYYFNRAWLDFRGRTTDEESGNGWAEGVHPDDLARCLSHYIASFDARLPFVMTYRLRHASGEYRWILDRGAPHSLPDGRFLGYYGGCAELDRRPPYLRSRELRASLVELRDFARDIAADEFSVVRVMRTYAEHRLRMPGVTPSHLERLLRMKKATLDLESLAQDMLAHRDTPLGQCR